MAGAITTTGLCALHHVIIIYIAASKGVKGVSGIGPGLGRSTFFNRSSICFVWSGVGSGIYLGGK
jgi:hypothetical protein